MVEPTNYLGASIFWLYIVFALVFTGKTLQTLYNLYTTTYKTKESKHTRQIWLFSILALLSFATLSATMLNVLIQSFNQRATLLGKSPLSSNSNENLPLAIWEWSTTSSLFADFAEGLVQDSARFFWAQTALLATLSTVIYMGTEGRQRQIPELWTFFALSQILPISFAQNLFYVALLLTSPEAETKENETNASTSQRILHFSKTHSILSAAAYCLCLALAQLYASTPALVPIVLLARLCLLFPLLIPAKYYPSLAAVPAKIPQDRATGDEVQRVVLKTALIMTCMKAYQAVQEGFGPEEITVALWAHPAVLALGGDVFLCAVSFSAWNWAGPRVRTRVAAAAKPVVAATSAKDKKKEAKAARKVASGRR
ncbi:hypothetical protein Q7P36_009343 [Cladosporium allicinum]